MLKIDKKSSIAAAVAVMMLLAIVVSTAAPVGAAGTWGASKNVLYLPATCGAQSSCDMGSWSGTWFTSQTFTAGSVTDVNTANLAKYDTVFMYASSPNALSAQEKVDLIAWVNAGGKLVLTPGEDAADASDVPWDWSWLPYPITLNTPGQAGAPGTLVIAENSKLTQDASGNPIDVAHLGTATDAVGDADVVVVQSPGWYASFTATNTNGVTGLVEGYAPHGQGIIIFSGLDWDAVAGDATLQQVMRNMFDVSTLPNSVPWTGNLDVTKVADKASYAVGDTITFTVTVTNKNSVDATNLKWTDTPPAEIQMATTTGTVGTGTLTANGGSVTFTVTAKAITQGTGLVNSISVVGDAPFSGVAKATFDIKQQQQIKAKLDVDPPIFFAKSNSIVWVTIASSKTFDATKIDPKTVKFGHAGTEASPIKTYKWDVENHDGLKDITFVFKIKDSKFVPKDKQALLTGYLVDGTAVQGTGYVKVL